MALLQRWQPRRWLERWHPREDWLSPFDEMRRTMDRMFDEFFRSTPLEAATTWAPSVDLYEDGNDLVLKAEIPGVSKDDLDVTIEDGVLRISGETKREEKTEDKGYYCQERYYGSFHRQLPLPVAVKEDQAKATFKNGVLEVRLPKAEEEKPKGRKIEISEA